MLNLTYFTNYQYLIFSYFLIVDYAQSKYSTEQLPFMPSMGG